MIRLYHGGPLSDESGSLWATPDVDYAAAFAQLHESALWMLTLDVHERDVLDLTGCGLDVSAVTTDLRFAGIAATVHAGDERHPMRVLRRITPDAIRAAGYRAVRLREWTDWGAEPSKLRFPGGTEAPGFDCDATAVVLLRGVLAVPDAADACS